MILRLFSRSAFRTISYSLTRFSYTRNENKTHLGNLQHTQNSHSALWKATISMDEKWRNFVNTFLFDVDGHIISPKYGVFTVISVSLLKFTLKISIDLSQNNHSTATHTLKHIERNFVVNNKQMLCLLATFHSFNGILYRIDIFLQFCLNLEHDINCVVFVHFFLLKLQ